MSKKPYYTKVTRLTVAPEGEPTFGEMATDVEIVDEGGGEFVQVVQTGRTDLGKIAIDPEDWPSLRAAIDQMIAKCDASA